MKAINYYLIVSDIKEEQKKIAGLILTEKTDLDNRYIKANVISCGSKVEGVNDGDVVYLTRLQWDIDRVARDYPDVRLTATKEMMV